MPEALSCPNCGAPLTVSPGQELALCLYCNATVSLHGETPGAPPILEQTLDEQAMAAVKQTLLDGRTADALSQYRSLSGASEADARQVIEGLGRQVSLAVVRSQQLTRSGVLIVAAFTVILLIGLAGLVSGWLNRWLSAAVVLLTAWNLAYYLPGLRTTLRFRKAPIAPAVTQKVSQIGLIKRRGQDIFTLKVLLEVQPAASEPFLTELILPVREQNLARAVPGTVIQVKYLPGSEDQPGSVVFHQT
jgi:hypothetical protein